MTIRLASEHDIPAIVELLKLSLGESRMAKSEALWRWKHVDNPFGKSPVLLAIENNEIIGVRAFMRWEWRQGDTVFRAVRAVDTSTHPGHQRKGIFKNLTLNLLKQCRYEGVDFIFNTPNASSKPGYLKMGWMSNGKMKIFVKPVLFRSVRKPNFDSLYSVQKYTQLWSEGFDSSRPQYLQTNFSHEFLHWRYVRSPNVRYYAFSDSEKSPTFITFFRLKPHWSGLEFRICDSIRSRHGDNTAHKKCLKRAILDSGASVVSSSERLDLFPSFPWHGPEITTYPLSFDFSFLSSDLWKPSLGDMELF